MLAPAMPAGRPPIYDPSTHPQQVFQFAILGLTDKQIAAKVGISEKTLNTWKLQHPELLQSLQDGKERADAKVAVALYQRAMGYSHDAVKIVADAKTGAVVTVPYVEHYPPDTAAAFIWLKNRHPELWRDRQHVVVEDPDKVLARVLGVEPDALPPPEPAQVVNEASNEEAGGAANLDLDKHQG